MSKPDISSTLDITTCDREPIHIPGSIQPYGYFLTLQEPGLTVCQVSKNVAEVLGRSAEDVRGKRLAELIGQRFAHDIMQAADTVMLEQRATYLLKVQLGAEDRAKTFDVIGHRRDGLLILELEPSSQADVSFRSLQSMVESFIFRLGTAGSVQVMSDLAAEEIRSITGFDRVLVYQFDPEWNGLVVAESRNDRLPSYLDLRFPSFDIPRQARELYRINRIRIIADVEYTPVPIAPANNPLTGKPLDLSFSVLRSVSPVHVQYMKNMGMGSSMSISILREGELWGLISCHHKTAKHVPFEVRMACDFLGQVFGLQLAAKEHASAYEHRVRLKGALSRLLAHMANAESFVEGLVSHPEELLDLEGANGAAIVSEGQCKLLGLTPSVEQVRRLTDWLASNVKEEVFSTDSLASRFAEAQAYAETASGLLSISVSKLHLSYILWFRPEVVQTVKWGGDPRKPTEPEPGSLRLHPRKSFEMWKETVRLRSTPWEKAELETAAEFRNVILGIVLRKAEELADLSRELERSNKELEAFSYSVSHDLRAPFRHIVGYAELLREMKSNQLDTEAKRYIDTIVESAVFAGKLVDNLLAFSQMGRSSLNPGRVDMNRLVEEVKKDVAADVKHRQISWRIEPLPIVWADAMMLKLAVRNLLANAVKYSGNREEAVIEVGSQRGDRETILFVRDNGIGFDMQYVGKLFGVFQRLHRMEEFEGTGIGLANVRRIVERHGGRAWAQGAVDQGATFYIALPDAPVSAEEAR